MGSARLYADSGIDGFGNGQTILTGSKCSPCEGIGLGNLFYELGVPRRSQRDEFRENSGAVTS